MNEFFAAQEYDCTVPFCTPEDVAGLAMAKGIPIEEAVKTLFTERSAHIARMRENPIYYQYEPPVWKLCDMLCGFPWVDKEEAERVRTRLGFTEPVKTLLALGGNRSSKTRYECRTAMKIMMEHSNARAWGFHSNHQQSVEYHHSLVYSFIPKGWRRQIKTKLTYISWTLQRGFSDDKFILDNGSECSFRNYSQDMRTAIEGGEPNIVFADELIPVDWAQSLEFRTATRAGWLIIGFTPVDGYSGTVGWFTDGATVALEEPAFLIPLDGGPALPHLALGLTEEQYAEILAAKRAERMPVGPVCAPRDLIAGEPVTVPQGRRFEKMPRVLRCYDKRKAVVFFHSSDNPYGNPLEVIQRAESKNNEWKRVRFYGFTDKTVRARFATFDERVHVVKAAAIPQHGTNYQVVDPCSGRAFFMLWVRATPDGKFFVYREWPSGYHIPGVGVPEPWAEPAVDARHLDGRKGKGQDSPGWGLAGYKREVARLEGWYLDDGAWQRSGSGWSRNPGAEDPQELAKMDCPADKTEENWIGAWNQHGPCRERIHERYMDARFANTKSFEEGGMTTLLEQFDEIGLTFYDASSVGLGWTINHGSTLIESALAYDRSRDLSFFNEPRLYVSDECVNLIFALKIWTGEDGNTGATKDPIDCLRMFFLKDCKFVETGSVGGNVAGGGCY